jgi:hypothetical protein
MSQGLLEQLCLGFQVHIEFDGIDNSTLYVKVYDSNQMDSSTFDPNQFKMAQREGWDSVAEGWKEWWEPIENSTTTFNCLYKPIWQNISIFVYKIAKRRI